jgi:hypothetical protein
MKKLFLLLVFIFFSACNGYSASIFLKNGELIKGKIVERTQDYIKVDRGTGVPMTYSLDEVGSIDDTNYEIFNHGETYATLRALFYEFKKWHGLHKSYPQKLCDLGVNNPIQPMYQYKDKATLPLIEECYDMKYSYVYELIETGKDFYLIVANPASGIDSEYAGKYSFCITEDGIVRVDKEGRRIGERTACVNLPNYEANEEEKAKAEKFITQKIDPQEELKKVLEKTTGKKVTSDNLQDVLMESFKHDAEWTFREFIADPIPESIQILKGETFSWMDFSGYVIFLTDEKTFKELSKDYKVIPNDIFVGNLFANEVMTDPNIVRYYKEKKVNDKQYHAKYLFWDKNNSKVYFHVSNAFYQSEEKGGEDF